MTSNPPNGWELARLDFGAADRNLVRNRVARVIEPLIPDRAHDVVLAVHEIAVNSIVHGGGRGNLGIWHTGDELVSEIGNPPAPTSPTVRHPSPEQPSGRGMWLAQSLTDAMTIDVTTRCITVQVRLRLPSPTPRI